MLLAAALLLPTFGVLADVALSTLYSFQVFEHGSAPSYGALVWGGDGNFYGATAFGGAYNAGTVFKISTNGALTTLHAFTGGNDGANPFGGLLRGSDGNFFGTTSQGGMHDWGTVFKISTNGALTTLYTFTGGNDGGNPSAGLVQASDGNFYGTTTSGGTSGTGYYGYGTVFKISPNGALTSLHSFAGGSDGADPEGALVQGSDGLLYGMTPDGGTRGGYGTFFQISTNGGALTILYSFSGTNDGGNPLAGLLQGSDGNFYGTTTSGGTNGGYGTVFRITTMGALTSLHSFAGGSDGANPHDVLVEGDGGSFYGTTYAGGTNNLGTVFEISNTGALTRLYSFTGANGGANPHAGLVRGGDGNFYGTTYGLGDPSGQGTVFRIAATGSFTSLFSFTADLGAVPLGGLVWGNDGNFYGTTIYARPGSLGYYGYGTLFKISTNGAFTSLYPFTGADDGSGPVGLVQGNDGNLYGTTSQGGTHNWGTVFKISPTGAFTSLYSFTGGNDGAFPGGLVQSNDGDFYGTTSGGGEYTDQYGNSLGTVFKISTTGVLTSLYSFRGGNDGGSPNARLVQGNDGNFYGVARGTVFKIGTTGGFTSLYSFGGTNDGEAPSGLVQGHDGNFYGTTSQGGTSNAGTVFRISNAGALTTLYSFTGGSDGAYPDASLVEGNDGGLYGTTAFGGTNSHSGTVFRISTNGVLNTVYTFLGGNDGANPNAALAKGTDGYFYGTTPNGGVGLAGTVFRLKVPPIGVPNVSNITAATFQDQPLNLAVAKILVLASDPNGSSLRVKGLGAPTNNDASVVLGQNQITYTPAPGYVGSDQFSYSLTDAAGASASAYVFVQVRATNQLSANMFPLAVIPGGYLVSFAGIPGQTYSVQRAPAVTGPWATITMVTAGLNGIGAIQDTNSPPSTAFYRTTYP
jgi:uncharacterized repeat protein (TIGR03803 family)